MGERVLGVGMGFVGVGSFGSDDGVWTCVSGGLFSGGRGSEVARLVGFGG